MMKFSVCLLAPILAISAAAAQPAGTERLVSPSLPGFVTGHSAANAQQSILEQIPAGESVRAWTRMVTTQRYGGLARRARAWRSMLVMCAPRCRMPAPAQCSLRSRV